MFPVCSPPIRDGAVLIDDAGRIEAVGPDQGVPAPDDVQVASFEGAAITPGFVNTHTHLELTGIAAGPVTRPSFFDWIQCVRALKEGVSPEGFLEAARQGVRDCWRFGVTTVADTGDSGAVAVALSELGGSGIAFQEVFGPDPGQRRDAMDWLEVRYREQEDGAGDRVRIGVSPHAPYSVSAGLYRAVADFAGEAIPVAMHLAESQAESDLVVAGAGPFARMWEERGIALPLPARSPVESVARTGVLGVRPLIIHAVRVDDHDVSTLRDAGASVAACPVSNRAHGHGDPPVARWVEGGLTVGLGTDSVLSVGELDMLREVAALRGIQAMSAGEAFEWLTVRGARALGLEDEVGTLEEGRWGDLTVIAIGPGTGALEPDVLERGSSHILRTYLSGRCVYAREADEVDG